MGMMVKSLPDRLIACSLSASQHSSYIPLVHIASQIHRAAMTGDVNRLDRLWQLLCLNYPIHKLVQCLDLPDPNSQRTLLMLATEERMSKVVNWLIDNGAEHDGMARTSSGDTILHMAAACNATDIILLYHSRYNENYDDDEADIRLIDWPNDKGITPLHVACQKGHLDAVFTLVSLGASVEVEDDAGDTPLHYAASYGHLAVVSRLLHLGASAFAKNNLGYSASDVAFSFEVEQMIQDTVRSALEANKRVRSAKGSAAVGTSDMRSRYSSNISDEDSEVENQTIRSGNTLLQTPKSVVTSPPTRLPNKLQATILGHPPLSISTASLGPSLNPYSTPTSTLAPQDLPLPSPMLDPESSKALQRILARDQNAQAGFQAASAYKGLVAPALPSDTSTSPYSALSKESGYFSSRPPPSIRRGRTSSNDNASGSYTSSSATAVSSPSSSPIMLTRQISKPEAQPVTSIPMGAPIGSSPVRPAPPLPAPPHFALPALQSTSSKSSTSSFVDTLKRSGSAQTPKPSGMVSPLDAAFPTDINIPFGKRSLKHHASLADLRSQSATVSSQTQPLPPQLPLITKTTFGFGKSRTRSGT